ncbi:unnamed protein product [Xylocopa violacea]|uniref:Uncharacterized protein n=1 Tax=Xylocopa violacea TaxID=135666 RepID=A0ABP1NQH0_XYLVO
MQLVQQLFGSAIPMFANVLILLYICQRFLAAMRLRRKIMDEMREYATIVRRARDNLRYIGEQVTKGMGEIREDIGKELRITDRLTSQNTKLASILQRFTALEENVIELVRMDCNRESVRIETPTDVTEEIKRIVAAAERKNCQRSQETVNINELGSTRDHGRDITVPRNPLSKFSACSPRDATATATRKTVDCRLRIATTPEVRLLGESNRPLDFTSTESKRE